MVTDLWRVLTKIDTPRLHSVRWHSTTDGNIATPVIALISAMIPLRMAKNLMNFGPVTPEILWLSCMGGEST